MFVSKSLFVDYREFPKLAWWKVNCIDKYKFINDLQDEEKELEIIELGQKVEDVVGEYLSAKHGMLRCDVFEDNPLLDLDEEDEDILLRENKYKSNLEKNIERTLLAIKRKEPIIYQAGFLYDNFFVRVDYMVLNNSGEYDLIEVKAKTGVRKSPVLDGVKNKNKGQLESKFISDISFQKYVISKVFEKEGLGKLGNCYYSYLNYEYVKKGNLDINKLIILDRVDRIKTVVISSDENSKELTVDDTLLSFGVVEKITSDMIDQLKLSEKEFNKLFPFSGSKYIKYFGEARPFGTIFSRGIDKSDSAVRKLYYEGKINLEDLNTEDLSLFNKGTGDKSKSREFIDNFLHQVKNKDSIILEDNIREDFSSFNYPICFYDYESVSVPIPYIDKTSPYQQVVVQYSMHKLYEDGTIKHYGGILEGLSDVKSVRNVEIENNSNRVAFESEKIIKGSYKDLLEEFLLDIGDDYKDSTFIVWYKPFENSRNKESGKIFTVLRDKFLTINSNTYDLMDVFKKGYYFDLDFKGSNSIKYVLPALVPSMKYDGMDVPNGSVAMKLLNDIISGKIQDKDQRKEHLKNLLLYCGQDSIAMYEIYKHILTKI